MPNRYRFLFPVLAVFGVAILAAAAEPGTPEAMRPGQRGGGGTQAVVAETADSLTFRQPGGRTVVLKKHPERVVIAYPSLASAWYLAGGSAVGMAEARSADALPETARGLPSVGRFNNPNPEVVLGLRPDLVLLVERLEKHVALSEVLRRAGIASVAVTYDNYDEFLSVMELFCRLNGNAPETFPPVKTLVAEVDARCAKARTLPPTRFLTLFASGAGFSAEGDPSNTATMARRLGGINVAGAVRGQRLKFSLERVLLENPDVILVVTMGNPAALKDKLSAEWARQPAWGALKAVRERRLHFLPREGFLYVPGAAFPDAFRHLDGLLHPDAGDSSTG